MLLAMFQRTARYKWKNNGYKMDIFVIDGYWVKTIIIHWRVTPAITNHLGAQIVASEGVLTVAAIVGDGNFFQVITEVITS